tara:strand:- start:45102 stop:46316 length:1215 start_codon:yes stop_codon:yes gene_type:complete
MISIALSKYDKDVAADWEQIRIQPEKWKCNPWGDAGGGFWAVAIEDGKVLWYNDIEDGFNWSPFREHGVIDEYWCNQNDFDFILDDFAQVRSRRVRANIAPGNVPHDLLGPGRILHRQTTYWELESNLGIRCRVHFHGKCEFSFASAEYEEVLVLDTHALLLDHTQSSQTIMISGRPENSEALVGRLDQEIRSQTNGWRALSAYAIMDSAELLEGGHGVLLTAPEDVCAALMPLLQKAGANPYYSPGQQTQRAGTQRLLLLGRSYVVAEAFSFELLASSGAQPLWGAKRKFPRLREDGTSSVEVLLESNGVERSDVESWLAAWLAKNAEWFVGQSELMQSDRLYLADSFLRPPRVVHSELSDLAVRLDIASEARFWRDWYAKLVLEMRAEFPLITLRKVVNASD